MVKANCEPAESTPLVPVLAVQQGDTMVMSSCSWHVNGYRQNLWQLFLTGILDHQNIVTWSRQTLSQLNADLQQKREM